MEASPGFIFSILSFIGMFTVLVFIHEFGHFYTARKLGVKVDVFSIGFGKEVFGWYDKHGTRWKVCWVPLGGYVKFFGDAGAASNAAEGIDDMTDEEKSVSFHHKPLLHRAAIVAAGPLINLAFAIIIFTGLFMTYGEPYAPSRISEVMENSAAQDSGLQAGDLITEINGNSITRFADISDYVTINMGEALILTIKREGELKKLTLTPRLEKMVDRFGNEFPVRRIGVRSDAREYQQHGLFSGMGAAVDNTGRIMSLMLKTLGQVVTGLRSVTDMGGPVKIAQFSGQSASMGIISFISFMALISINLGLVNLLPIPMLDGGHLFLYGLEGIRRKPISQKVQEYAFIIGFIFLISLTVVLTWNDLAGLELW
jgi:regulator of sigma E protease